MKWCFVNVVEIILIFQLFNRVVFCQKYGPASILQDSRLEPKVDGTFGFLYRTEDGITSAARGNPDGQIQGRYTYTDPTGLKVNFNYFAGSRRAPGYSNDGPEDDGSYDPRKYENGEPGNNGGRQNVQSYQNNHGNGVPQSIYATKKFSSQYSSRLENFRQTPAPSPVYHPQNDRNNNNDLNNNIEQPRYTRTQF